MKKKAVFALFGLSAVLALSACSKTETETEAPAEMENAETSEDVSDEEDVYTIEYTYDEDESEQPLDAITPSDYLVDDIDDCITPGELEGISITQYTYEITDDVLQEQIDMELEMFSEEIEVDRASQEGDVIYVDLSYTVQGSEDEEAETESTFFTLGDEEYGADFDAALTGASTGDTLTFSISFDDESIVSDWAGQTVDFTAEITGVDEIRTPELDEDFVQEYTGYSTVDEYKSALEEALTEEYEELSLTDAYSSLIDTALESCVISSIPDELFQSCREELIDEYGSFFGTTDEDELLELTGLTSDDLDDEAELYAERRLLISYICEKNSLSVTEEDYDSYAEETASDYGYSSAYDFEQDFTRTGLVWTLYEEKAAEWLYQSADITYSSYDDSLLDDDWDEYYEDETGSETELSEDETADSTEDETANSIKDEAAVSTEDETATSIKDEAAVSTENETADSAE